MRALFIGSIGVLAETSRMQRACFNQAFKDAGLDWVWEGDDYAARLATAGGQKRIESYAAERGETVDAAALHARKSELFQQKLDEGVPLRDGVGETLQSAKAAGLKIAFVTTTSRANVDQILYATGLPEHTFDLIMDASKVDTSKPDPECYLSALHSLDVQPGDVVAFEDNPDGVKAALAANLTVYATPGAMHDAAAFDPAVIVLDRMALPDA